MNACTARGRAEVQENVMRWIIITIGAVAAWRL